MFTVVECRAKAKEKIELAALNPRRRRSLMLAAKDGTSWLTRLKAPTQPRSAFKQ